MENYKMEQITKYSGVKGWLLLLCLNLAVFTPLATLYNLITSYGETSEYFIMFPGLKRLFYVDGLLSFIITALSIRAGIVLWNIKPDAVKIAKNYLLIFLAYNALAVFLPFTSGLPAEVNEAMIPEIAKGIIQALIFFGVWYLYLNKSKRVKATYNTEVASEEYKNLFIEKYR